MKIIVLSTDSPKVVNCKDIIEVKEGIVKVLLPDNTTIDHCIEYVQFGMISSFDLPSKTAIIPKQYIVGMYAC